MIIGANRASEMAIRKDATVYCECIVISLKIYLKIDKKSILRVI